MATLGGRRRRGGQPGGAAASFFRSRPQPPESTGTRQISAVKPARGAASTGTREHSGTRAAAVFARGGAVVSCSGLMQCAAAVFGNFRNSVTFLFDRLAGQHASFRLAPQPSDFSFRFSPQSSDSASEFFRRPAPARPPGRRPIFCGAARVTNFPGPAVLRTARVHAARRGRLCVLPAHTRTCPCRLLRRAAGSRTALPDARTAGAHAGARADTFARGRAAGCTPYMRTTRCGAAPARAQHINKN